MWTKKEKDELAWAPLRIVLFITFMLFVVKGCNYLSGATQSGVFQLEQMKLLGTPPNTQFITKYQPFFARSTQHAWLTLSYETTLSEKQVLSYYHKKLIYNRWKKMTLVNSSFHWDKMDKPSFLSDQDHHLGLTFIPITASQNKLGYIIKIEWGKRAELENIKSSD